MYWVFDEETFPNCFTFTIIREDSKYLTTFECSEQKNDFPRLMKCIQHLVDTNDSMVGFNNLGFDYPILHKLMQDKKCSDLSGKGIAARAWKLAQEQIDSGKDGFAETIPVDQQIVPQVDLYKIWHFDNKAKSTSLKLLEFNMRSETIADLPYAVGSTLTPEQIKVLVEYNQHDVLQTLKFFLISKPQVVFREELTKKYGRNFMNHNDTKIGKDYFIMRLEEAGIELFTMQGGKRKIKQTQRPVIKISECLFKYYDFQRDEFKAILEWFNAQRIRETKGVFSDIPEHKLGNVAKYAAMETKRKKLSVPRGEKPSAMQIELFKREYPMGWIEEVPLKSMYKGQQVISYWMVWREATNLNVVIDGFRFDFGTGGLHGSIENKVVKETLSYQIEDADVSSMYPNIGIANRVYPLHLTDKFCDIYEDVYNQRKAYKKGTAENAMLKLALNGVYGDSNNQYGPFFDPQYTMTITINGQLSLCLLAEKLLTIPDLKLVQVNTDGITVACKRERMEQYKEICAAWQKQVGLELEFATYKKMYIRDVNNYLALYTNGKVKRKGVYQYEDLGWHQNQGGLVISKAAEAFMLHGTPIAEFVKNHKDHFDFMLRTKVPRSSKLVLRSEAGLNEEGKIQYNDVQQQNVCRYYPSKDGAKLIKVMPPLKGKDEDRNIGIDKEWNVKVCNNMVDFDGKIDYDYFIAEAEKLVIPRIGPVEEIKQEEDNE